jgi:hypothetical protein
MIRFPIDLRVGLMKNGLRISPWVTKVFAMPVMTELDPEILAYRFKTVHGILCFSPTLQGLTIIAISNDEPGNGEFPVVMEMMEKTAREAGLPMIVGSIWNESLRAHLIDKRGYKPCVEPNCEDAVIKRPSLTV